MPGMEDCKTFLRKPLKQHTFYRAAELQASKAEFPKHVQYGFLLMLMPHILQTYGSVNVKK